MLNPVVIKARDLSEAWFLCVDEAYSRGREYVVQKGSFETIRRKEIPLVAVCIEYPGTRPLSPSVPEGIPPVANEREIEDYFTELMNPEKAPGQDYTYGTDLSLQVPEVIARYKQWGFNQNRCCMTVGSPLSIFEYRKEEQTGQKASSQCLRLVDTRIQDDALHFIIYFRSWDLWAGFPVNMGGIQLLKEYMASEIGVDDGSLIAFSKGLHLYEHCWALARVVLGM